MDEDNDFPIINIPSEEEEVEEVNEIETKTEPEPEEFFKKPEMSLKEKRLESLRKAREARKKKKETKKAPEPAPAPEPKTNVIDYDLLVNTIVDKLEDNKAKRKAKKHLTQVKQNAELESNKPINQVEIESNVYDKLFGF
tara:strand:+ start:4247 stop:4666 length:420 start_codon:yes stop_codon:yes gene_type:complete